MKYAPNGSKEVSGQKSGIISPSSGARRRFGSRVMRLLRHRFHVPGRADKGHDEKHFLYLLSEIAFSTITVDTAPIRNAIETIDSLKQMIDVAGCKCRWRIQVSLKWIK